MQDGRVCASPTSLHHSSVLPLPPLLPAGTPPGPRSAHAAAVFRDRYLLVFGGGSVAHCNNELHCLDTQTMEWSQPGSDGPVPPPRAGEGQPHKLCKVVCMRVAVHGCRLVKAQWTTNVWPNLFPLGAAASSFAVCPIPTRPVHVCAPPQATLAPSWAPPGSSWVAATTPRAAQTCMRSS